MNRFAQGPENTSESPERRMGFDSPELQDAPLKPGLMQDLIRGKIRNTLSDTKPESTSTPKAPQEEAPIDAHVWRRIDLPEFTTNEDVPEENDDIPAFDLRVPRFTWSPPETPTTPATLSDTDTWNTGSPSDHRDQNGTNESGMPMRTFLSPYRTIPEERRSAERTLRLRWAAESEARHQERLQRIQKRHKEFLRKFQEDHEAYMLDIQHCTPEFIAWVEESHRWLLALIEESHRLFMEQIVVSYQDEMVRWSEEARIISA